MNAKKTPGRQPGGRQYLVHNILPIPEDDMLYGSSFPPFSDRKPRGRQSRTTKTNEKLVLFPEEHHQDLGSFGARNETDSDYRDPHHEVLVPDTLQDSSKTLAERYKKDERWGLPRATCYCSCESFQMEPLKSTLKSKHGLVPKKYDEAIYLAYEPAQKERLLAHISVKEEPSSEIYPWMARSEVFVFDYGVVVFWNFSRDEEESYLSFLEPFANGLLPESEFEIEDFHFQYDLQGSLQPRIYNDMITLKSKSPLIKLTISHGLAQSTKLALFENMMEGTIDGTAELPRMMAKFGQVNMSRSEIMKIVGKLFKLKINVNLISNVLDTPEVFWSEPELEVLYNAVRVYLEINQRAKLLNTRADVLTDLLDMLSDHLNSNEMMWITWIIIILICIAVVIAIAEVFVKVLKLSSGLPD